MSRSRRVNAERHDFYETVGVSAHATEAEIRTAFLKKSKMHHPDKGGESETFIELMRAYEVLSNPSQRAKYDAEVRYHKGVEERGRERREREAEQARRDGESSRPRQSAAFKAIKFYVAPTGQCYHHLSSCGGLRAAKAVKEVGRGELEGKRPCLLCTMYEAPPPPASTGKASVSPPGKLAYYFTGVGRAYHTRESCRGLRAAKEVFSVPARRWAGSPHAAVLRACKLCC